MSSEKKLKKFNKKLNKLNEEKRTEIALVNDKFAKKEKKLRKKFKRVLKQNNLPTTPSNDEPIVPPAVQPEPVKQVEKSKMVYEPVQPQPIVEEKPTILEEKPIVEEKPVIEEKIEEPVKPVLPPRPQKKTNLEEEPVKEELVEEYEDEIEETVEEVDKPQRKGLYRVIYDKDNRQWIIKKDGNEKITRRVNTKKEALEIVERLCENQDLKMIVHKRDGKFQKQKRNSSSNN